jgi:hypothetical protein
VVDEAARPTVPDEPDAPADDPPPPATTPLPVIPLAEQVEAMAQAMMANPVHHGITNREKAMEYFRANALTRLCATSDPLARGLLLGWERHRGAMAVHSRPTGR